MMLLDVQPRCMQHRILGLSGQRFTDVMNDIVLLMSLVQATQILTQYGVGAFVEVGLVFYESIIVKYSNHLIIPSFHYYSFDCY